MLNYTLLSLFLHPWLHSLAGLVEATENYVEALPAWAACGGGNSKCFMCSENLFGASLCAGVI